MGVAPVCWSTLRSVLACCFFCHEPHSTIQAHLRQATDMFDVCAATLFPQSFNTVLGLKTVRCLALPLHGSSSCSRSLRRRLAPRHMWHRLAPRHSSLPPAGSAQQAPAHQQQRLAPVKKRFETWLTSTGTTWRSSALPRRSQRATRHPSPCSHSLLSSPPAPAPARQLQPTWASSCRSQAHTQESCRPQQPTCPPSTSASSTQAVAALATPPLLPSTATVPPQAMASLVAMVVLCPSCLLSPQPSQALASPPATPATLRPMLLRLSCLHRSCPQQASRALASPQATSTHPPMRHGLPEASQVLAGHSTSPTNPPSSTPQVLQPPAWRRGGLRSSTRMTIDAQAFVELSVFSIVLSARTSVLQWCAVMPCAAVCAGHVVLSLHVYLKHIAVLFVVTACGGDFATCHTT